MSRRYCGKENDSDDHRKVIQNDRKENSDSNNAQSQEKKGTEKGKKGGNEKTFKKLFGKLTDHKQYQAYRTVGRSSVLEHWSLQMAQWASGHRVKPRTRPYAQKKKNKKSSQKPPNTDANVIVEIHTNKSASNTMIGSHTDANDGIHTIAGAVTPEPKRRKERANQNEERKE
ncbi:hypothetical protein BJ165DRAFT_1408511 [Panaeolus papilionaceus]|nr:hypothetical protein BJ165DRAFT_1408511 [Panaeolus papilionaceus]